MRQREQTQRQEQMLRQAQIQQRTVHSTTSNSGGFTDEQLTDTNQTRTIYRNSDGHPLVITPDGNGNWVDFDGNTYTFTGEVDAYDAEGNSYYWHGEAAGRILYACSVMNS